MLETVFNDKIKFERPGTDPNVLVKVCVTLMIAASNEGADWSYIFMEAGAKLWI